VVPAYGATPARLHPPTSCRSRIASAITAATLASAPVAAAFFLARLGAFRRRRPFSGGGLLAGWSRLLLLRLLAELILLIRLGPLAALTAPAARSLLFVRTLLRLRSRKAAQRIGRRLFFGQRRIGVAQLLDRNRDPAMIRLKD